MEIITECSYEFENKRANKAKKMIKGLIENDKDIKNNANSK